jgi:hypothetical protein
MAETIGVLREIRDKSYLLMLIVIPLSEVECMNKEDIERWVMIYVIWIGQFISGQIQRAWSNVYKARASSLPGISPFNKHKGTDPEHSLFKVRPPFCLFVI